MMQPAAVAVFAARQRVERLAYRADGPGKPACAGSPGPSAIPTAGWVNQAARNLVMDLQDAGAAVRYLIRDRDGRYPPGFDAVLQDAGIQVVLSGVRMPRTNSIMERRVLTCSRELLDRVLIWNTRHLVHILREFEIHYNSHRPHQSLD